MPERLAVVADHVEPAKTCASVVAGQPWWTRSPRGLMLA
jgi:hypothetical protein